MLDGAELPERVRARARAVFSRLADVEGAIHGIDPADVEFHEVGSLDSIIDVVGVCAALESLDVDEVRCSQVAIGTGTIRTAHGDLPNPAPATMALLSEAGAPIRGLDTTLEVTTPTGAALMTTLAAGFGPAPAMSLVATGFGAGTADTPDRANIVQVVLGTFSVEDAEGTPVTLLETNVDDVTGEVLAQTIAELIRAGAHDAWATPIVMKKGRPAHTVSALCDPADAGVLRGLLLRETGSLGVRSTMLVRWPQQRAARSVDVDGQTVRIKVGSARVKVEFDDAARAARALGIPVRVVIERAIAAAPDGAFQTPTGAEDLTP